MADSAPPNAFAFQQNDLPALSLEPRPTWIDMDALHREINTNASSEHAAGGNGQLGYLAVVVSAETYQLQSGGIPWIAPEYPGEHPVHDAGATGPQITETNRDHAVRLRSFEKYVAVSNALKVQLRAAVPKDYLEELADRRYGFLNVTVLDMLNHLDAKFGKITTKQIAANEADLKRTWTPTVAMEPLWAHVDKCRDFATNAGEGISDRLTMSHLITNFETSGIFATYIHDWNKFDEDAQTWPAFKIHFNAANENRLHLLTTRNAGFQGNALAATAANPAAADPTPVEHAFAAPAVVPPSPGPAPQMYYCWSHGLSDKAGHTSATCRSRFPGHVPTATVNNMLGGCNHIQRQARERPVWVSRNRAAATAAAAAAAAAPAPAASPN